MHLPICWLVGHKKRRPTPFAKFVLTFTFGAIGHYRCVRCQCVVWEFHRPKRPSSFRSRKFPTPKG